MFGDQFAGRGEEKEGGEVNVQREGTHNQVKVFLVWFG